MKGLNSCSRKLLILLVGLSVFGLTACTPIQTKDWRAKDYNRPPNWEEDFGYPRDRW